MDKAQNIDVPGLLTKATASNSAEALILVALGIAIWVIGGNVLVATHYRRLGKSSWSWLNPFTFPFKRFNARELVALVVLGVASFMCFGFALGWR